LLSYRLPREPSDPRTTLWRRLKPPGVAQDQRSQMAERANGEGSVFRRADGTWSGEVSYAT